MALLWNVLLKKFASSFSALVMGVQDLFDQLKKLGLLPLPIDTRSINGDIHIDLFGIYYLKIQNHLAEKYGPSRAVEVRKIIAATIASAFATER
jgi:hypothetical protein